MKESQSKRIRKHIESGKSLTPLEALHYFGCFRLGARIFELKKQGMPIITEMIDIVSDGVIKQVAKYKLEKI